MKRYELIIIFICLMFFFSVENIFPAENELRVENLKGDTINLNQNLNPSQMNIIVFLALPTCHDCCLKLNKFFVELSNKEKNIRFYSIIGLSGTKSNIMDKRLDMNYFKKYFKFPIDYFFVYNSADNFGYSNYDSELFKKYNIINTPAVLITSNNKYLYINYDELFENETFNSKILESTINKLRAVSEKSN